MMRSRAERAAELRRLDAWLVDLHRVHPVRFHLLAFGLALLVAAIAGAVGLIVAP